jgi:hypothetical protein
MILDPVVALVAARRANEALSAAGDGASARRRAVATSANQAEEEASGAAAGGKRKKVLAKNNSDDELQQEEQHRLHGAEKALAAAREAEATVVAAHAKSRQVTTEARRELTRARAAEREHARKVDEAKLATRRQGWHFSQRYLQSKKRTFS